MTDSSFPVSGAGLGLRREMLEPLAAGVPDAIGFFEVAPENWMEIGGRYGRAFREFTERRPFITHGLSLSVGGPAPLDLGFVRRLKRFLDTHGIRYYSEHLSYTSDGGQLYDLMPIPFTEEAVKHVAARIRTVQDVLEREIAIENVSFYAAPAPARMTELQFLNAVLERADCGLLLDVNNIHVNSINHRYDAQAFLAGIPAERVRYLHVAGHYVEAEDLRVDTHGSDVIEPVWALLRQAYERFGAVPTVLERDFNIPPLPQLLGEVGRIRELQRSAPARPPRPAKRRPGPPVSRARGIRA